MSNLAAARAVLERVRAAGVADFCICGGSRNAPLVAALTDGRSPLPEQPASTANGQRSTVNVFTFVDERSAAFFALGRVKRDDRPVAVITTSGTAVAELLPAAVEAYYSGAPLVLITADRPARFRGTAAPQSIEQIGIFGPYAQTDADRWDKRAPLHINIEFDEPLIDE